jgi:putative transposase
MSGQVGASRTTRIFAGGRNGVWRSRGYIPHFEGVSVIQHVTFRLADSLPKEALEKVEWELDLLEKQNSGSTRQAEAWRSLERRKRVEELMDAGFGSCLLKESKFARLVEDALKHFDGVRYRLMAWVVMPNHVHVLFEPIAPWTMAKVVWCWKGFTGRRISEELRRREDEGPEAEPAKRKLGGPTGPTQVWFREYWDRFVRNERHMQNVVEYIHQNPVKAGLVSRAEDWLWSSARARICLESK